MGFWLKKCISAILLPLPFGLLFLGAGLVLLLCCRAKRTRTSFLVVGFLMILIFSLNVVSIAMINHLQSQYKPLIHPSLQITKVVVLGSGVTGEKIYPPNLTLGPGSLSRLVEGIRLFNLVQQNHADAKLILSGGRVFQAPSASGKMRNIAVMLGISPEKIILENGSRDTHDEATYMQKMIGKEPFILVTSAFHMPRAMALFKHLGMKPIAAPTEYMGSRYRHVIGFAPNASSLVRSDIAIHEYLGMLWAWLRGYI
ncbi:MAG TPA: ElyC/SanA/YdcF family protein [Coxiellaceae bacterium]|nr:ElyC/SanA/YdcF family protein [Coxiellaceae bacterium]